MDFATGSLRLPTAPSPFLKTSLPSAFPPPPSPQGGPCYWGTYFFGLGQIIPTYNPAHLSQCACRVGVAGSPLSGQPRSARLHTIWRPNASSGRIWKNQRDVVRVTVHVCASAIWYEYDMCANHASVSYSVRCARAARMAKCPCNKHTRAAPPDGFWVWHRVVLGLEWTTLSHLLVYGHECVGEGAAGPAHHGAALGGVHVHKHALRQDVGGRLGAAQQGSRGAGGLHS